jgi:hypothetical protein
LRDLAGTASPPVCTDSLGLIASRHIRVACEAVPTNSDSAVVYDAANNVVSGPACLVPATVANDTVSAQPEGTNRYGVGAWMALGCEATCGQGIISTQRWASAGKNGTAVPNLYFYGSLTSNYRAVFGTTVLPETNNGINNVTQLGLAKQFRFDPTLKDRQPPYFLEPTTDTWERVDLVEMAPCKAGLFGQTPQGAGC